MHRLFMYRLFTPTHLLLLFSAFILLAGMPLKAQIFVEQIEGAPLQAGEILTVQDEGLDSPNPSDNGIYGIDNRIIFAVLRGDSLEPVPAGSYELLLELRFWELGDDYAGPPRFARTYTMIAAANTGGGQVPLADEVFQDSRRMEIEVLRIRYNGSLTLPEPAPRMRLLGEVSLNLDGCSLNTGQVLAANFFASDTELDSVATVGYVDCAAEYDFEYAFFDEDSPEGRALASEGAINWSLDELFRHNATRLTSAGEDFRIFGLYRRGYVVARYRAVSHTGSGLRLHTRWSGQGEQLFTNGNERYAGVMRVDHQSELNWQAMTNFAEEAKQLPSVSYLDGTMRGRQNLVLQYGESNGVPNPASEFVIGQQTIYDAMGRPAVAVLPAPLYPEQTPEAHPLRFAASQLARPEGSSDVYGKAQVEAATDCAAAPMGTQAGAGSFYSPDNVRVDSTNAFVPDAEGYPFAVTRYTADNTGRVRRQGGVGPRLQAGAHDTRYFYGKPNQWELDRLFGVNVGEARHYQKTMVIDPNGQASVSYLDAKGRTVATALAGDAPPGLIPLKQVTAGFSFRAEASDTSGLTFSFSNQSQGAEGYRWNFADLDSSTVENPTFTFPELGTYAVCLTAEAASGHEDRYCQYVRVVPRPPLVYDTIVLQRGLNLVGLDVVPRDRNIAAVFSSLKNLLYVQGRDSVGGLALYNPQLTDEENVLKAVEPGRGYLVGVTQADTLIVEGVRLPADFRPPLHPGVNLLAYLPRDSAAPADYFSFAPAGVLDFARAYDGQRFWTYRPPYAPAAEPFRLQHGRAYELLLTDSLPGDVWEDQYAEDELIAAGINEGFNPYTADLDSTELDRRRLGVGDENDLSPLPEPEPTDLATGNPIEASILDNVRYDDRVETTYSLLVPARGRYDLCYALAQASYCQDCTDDVPGGTNPPGGTEVCYDCAYDVSVSLTAVGACGGDTRLGTLVERRGVALVGSLSDCFGGDELGLDSLVLEVGEYHLTKTVRVSEARIAAAERAFLDTTACIMPLETFTQRYLDSVDLRGCAPLTEQDTFNSCDALRAQLRADLYPGGQYARFDTVFNDEGDIADYRSPVGEPRSLFLWDGATENFIFQQLPWNGRRTTVRGQEEEVAELSLKDFIDYFDETWLDVLLDYHPERCLLTFCEQQIDNHELPGRESSYAWDALLRSTETYAGASAGLGVTTSLASRAGIEDALDALRARDPFFTQAAQGSWSGSFALQLYANAQDNNNVPTIMDAQLRAWLTPTGGGSWTWSTTAARAYERDLAWRLLRDLYLARKTRFVEERMIAYAQGCANQYHQQNWQCLSQPACERLDCTPLQNCDGSVYSGYTARTVLTTVTKVSQAGSPASLDELYHGEPWGTLATAAADTLTQRCEDNCAAYRPAWAQALRACAGIDTLDIPAILNELEAICATGCGEGSFYGVSSVPEGLSAPGTLRTFTEVVTAYLDPAACPDADCSPALLNFPAPAAYDAYGGTLTLASEQVPVWLVMNRAFLESRLDELRRDCACQGCAAVPAPGPQDSVLLTEKVRAMAALNRMAETEVWRTLRVVEEFLAGRTAGLFPSGDVQIPAELNAGGRYCIRRTTLEQLDNLALSQSCADSLDEEGLAAARAAYLNGQLGWSRTYADYARLLDSAQTCLICAEPPAAPLPASPPPLSCEEQLLAEAREEAALYYQGYRARQLADFSGRYRRACLAGVDERLRLRYVPREYHYTLYYYDQAGNLAQTVPPHGVAPLGNPDDTLALERYRAAIAESVRPAVTNDELLPAHALLTHYRYNSFNEVVESDAPDRDAARTWYDRLGRPVLSQDGRQDSLQRVSYTLYDELGRPTEVGELPLAPPDIAPGHDLAYLVSQSRFTGGLRSALLDRGDRYQVTRTHYTAADLAYQAPGASALTLRNRVAATTYRAAPLADDIDDGSYTPGVYDFASHYVYDIAGNVTRLVQDLPELAGLQQRYKTLEYTYDLISGNVHDLHYQRGEPDQFSYHFGYDKLNRLVDVLTSELETRHSQSNLWRREAAYLYYDHGPLRRTVLGQERLQGLDYAYTLQGWIKGLNGSLGDDYRDQARRDMNLDGYYSEPGYALDWLRRRDVLRWANQYFAGDYRPIGGGLYSPFDAVLPPDYELFNGNIVRHYQSTVVDSFRTTALVGEYDQLHRLRYGLQESYGHDTRPDRTPSPAYEHLRAAVEAPRYDGAGNILSLRRSFRLAEGALAGTGEADITGGVNELSYDYLAGTNLLKRVRGTVASDRPTAAWQPFAYLRDDHTYTYDRSGNLIRQTEAGAGTTTIDWNAYGKVTTVTQAGVAPQAPYRTRFGYGPDQQRWTKHRHTAVDGGSEETVATTYYIRDAQGSVLATYELEQTLNTASGALSEAGPFVLRTHYLYGSARLGEVVRELPLQAGITPPDAFGRRHYEITNHLGNVATVIGEHVIDYTDITGRTYQVPEVLEQRDYLPFGLGLARQADEHHAARGGVGLQLNTYRFGFNGKELDDEGEWGDNQTAYDYGFRIYNPQVGRFLSVDPMSREGADINPYNFVYNTPLILTDPNGLWPIYGTDGEYLGDDGQSAPGLDLAFTGKAAVDDQGNTVFTDLQQFTDNHTEFQTTANIVKHEGTTSDADEYLWIAHTANNAASSAGRTVHKQLMTGYSSVPKEDKTPLSISDNSTAANAARAGVIDVLLGNGDPTSGAQFWDGTDFLAWGLNSPNGTPQNKFEEYSVIFIDVLTFNDYEDAQKSRWGNTVRYGKNRYNIPADVFNINENPQNWGTYRGSVTGTTFGFYFTTGHTGNSLILNATGTAGESVFWRVD